jgi:hypothetical protein
MKLLLIKCGICSNWFKPSAHTHCPLCGAYRIEPKGMRTFYIRKDGTELVRGFPMNVDGCLNRLIKRVGV